MNDGDARDHESRIRTAWRRNAAAWTKAVRTGAIASRVRVTDRAVVDAVTTGAPSTVLDVGCGEGWLVRELAQVGIAARGIDADPALVKAARQAGGRFDVLDYHDLDTITDNFDAVVCNFSLLGETSTAAVFAAVPALLNPAGRFIVQTLHPVAACGDAPYADGWREGSWQGCGDGFGESAPWYFRTVETWHALFAASGLAIVESREPADPDSGEPPSMLFIARRMPKPL